MRYAMPALAALALIGVILASTATDSRSGPPPRRIVIESPDATAPVAMTWDVREMLNTRFIGLTEDRDTPSGVATVGTGAGLIDLLSGTVGVFDGFATRTDLLAAFLDDPDDLKVIGWQAGRARLWHVAEPDEEDRSDPLQQTGLEEPRTVVGAVRSDSVELILGTDDTGRLRVWISSGDGQWRRRDVRGIRRAELDVLVEHDGVFFAAGSGCEGGPCVPAMWRSPDGIEWTEVGDFGPIPGTVTGISASESGVLSAVGTVAPGLGSSWQSTDGGNTWSNDGARGLGDSIRISVLGLDVESSPRTALLLVDGERVEVGEGTVLVTPLGEVAIPALGDVAVFIAGDEVHAVELGAAWELYADTRVEDVDAFGGRIVAVGSRTLPGARPQPMVWVREERSLDWLPNVLTEATALPAELSIGHSRLAVVGSTDRDSVVWLGTWSAPSVERGAIAALDGLLHGLSAGDLARLQEFMGPAADPGSGLDLPGLAGMAVQPWDQRGVVDEDALTDVADFAAHLDVAIAIGDCTARPEFGDINTVVIDCTYVTESSLHELLQIEPSEGTLRATTRSGLVTDISATDGDEVEAWDELAAFIEAYGPELFRTGADDLVDSRGLRPDARTAGIILAAAGELDRMWFFPGETRTTESPFGTLEVSWIVEPFGARETWVNAVAWTGDAFVAATSSWDVDELSPLSGLWTSPDGTTWTAMSGPRPMEIYRLWAGPGERLVAVEGISDGTDRLWLIQSGIWRELDAVGSGDGPGNEQTWIEDVALNVDGVLVVRGSWDEATDTIRRWARYVGSDGTATPLEVPFTEAGNVGLVAGSQGFLLVTQSDPATRVWRSRRGHTWELLAEMETDTFGWLRELVLYRDRFLALTMGDWEEHCGDEWDECFPPQWLWDSDTGTTWNRVMSSPSATLAGAEGIATGEVGLVLATRLPGNHLLFWMSPDGTAWSAPQALLPKAPTSGWLSAGEPVVGDSGFVLPVSFQASDREAPLVSFIVARLVAD